MANVPGTFYTAETQRRGTTPVSPPSAVDDPQDPINPGGPPVVPPVAERYASEAAMIADQLNQKSGYLYFDGTDTWWYLGTTNGDITDYEALGMVYPADSTGSVIAFDRPRTYDSPGSPNTNTTLTEDNTQLRPVTQVIFHQAASFNPPATWEKSTGSDDYDPAKINIIYVEAFSATYKRYIIDHDE